MQMINDVVRDIERRLNSPLAILSASTQNLRCGHARLANILWGKLFFCVVVLLFAAQASAQITGSGSIQGTVSDSTGAVIPNATVTLTEQSTQVTRTVTSGTSGAYAFPNINVGTYSLTVAAPGFETYTSTGNVLEIGSSIAINPALTVGKSTSQVNVHAEGLTLQTEDTSFKQTIDRRQLLEMPLQGRHMTDLILGAGGANPSSVQDATGSKFPYQAVTISIAGASGNSISYRLDGGDNQDYMGGGNNPLPFPDAVGQFSVETATLGPQDGVHSGGLVNVVTNSGTNVYHGSAFEFIRNNYLDATNFFSNIKDQLHQNQYGGTFGGPVRIPGLYNGKDKFFFFAAYQHTKSTSQSATQTAYLPTAANLAGDFSVTDSQQLYDPITGQALPGNKYNQPGGPTLPTWNPQALALLKFLPPVVPLPDGSDAIGRVQYAIPNNNYDNQFDTREDYTINAKNNMYVRYFIDGYQQPAFFFPNNILVTSQSGNIERYQTITIGENYIINSGTVNSAHFTATRRQNTRGFAPTTPNATTLGVDAYQALPAGLWISASNKGRGFTAGGGSNLQAVINDNIPVDFSDDLNLVRGRHQIVLGGEFVRNQLNLNNGYQANGNFIFNGEYSGSGPAGGTKIGDVNLDFLEGAMSGFTQSKFQQNALRGSIPSLYLGDTYHATKKLTLIAGIRWQPLFYPVDYFHRGTIFDMTAFLNNQTSSIYPKAPAGSFYYGDKGVPPAFTKNSPWNFVPNVGASYDLYGDGKTVIRGGLAYEYDQPNFFTSQRVQQSPPFATLASPDTSAQLCFSHPWVIGGTGYGCSATGGTDTSPYPQPEIPTPATATFPAQAQYIVLQSKYQMPDTLQWTASVQQQFPHGWTGQIDYIGNRTQHLLLGLPLNPAVFIPGVWGANGTGCDGIVRTGPAAVKPGTAGSPCSTTGNQRSRFALTIANPLQGNQYQGGGGGSLLESNSGYATYNGMIVTVQHRLSSTFSLLSNYTWQQCLNNADPQGDISGTQFEQPSNPRRDYARCGSTPRHIFNTSLIVRSEFPITGLKGYLLNNWELAPLIHINSGTPFNITAGTDGSLTDVNNDRPNLIPGINPYRRVKITTAQSAATRSYLNPAAFCNYGESTCPSFAPAPGTYGNLGRNAFTGPKYVNVDAQISRIFPLNGRFSLDTRLEAFNVLNHPNFANPTSNNSKNPTSATFGQLSETTTTAGITNGARVFQLAAKVIF